jgi:hypothetical protein
VANGSDSANGNGRSFGGLGPLAGALENRIVLLFSAALLGIGGNLAIVTTQPDVRADPFTGAMGKSLENRIIALENEVAEDDKLLRRFEVMQAMDDQHRKDAVDGYARIRAIERQCSLNNERITEIRKDVNRFIERNGK